MYPLVFRFLYGIVQFVGVLILYYYLLELAPMQYLYADLFVVVRPPTHTHPKTTLSCTDCHRIQHHTIAPTPLPCTLTTPPSLLASCHS